MGRVKHEVETKMMTNEDKIKNIENCRLECCHIALGGISLDISKMENGIYHHYRLALADNVANNDRENSGSKISEQIWPMLEKKIIKIILHSERKAEIQFGCGSSLFTWMEEGEPFEYLMQYTNMQTKEWYPFE